MKAIENGLKRFEKGTKVINGTIALKGTRVKKSQRVAMSVIYDRLKNNLNNEIENGARFSKKECEALGLETNGSEYSFFYLDRKVITNERIIVYWK